MHRCGHVPPLARSTAYRLDARPAGGVRRGMVMPWRAAGGPEWLTARLRGLGRRVSAVVRERPAVRPATERSRKFRASRKLRCTGVPRMFRGAENFRVKSRLPDTCAAGGASAAREGCFARRPRGWCRVHGPMPGAGRPGSSSRAGSSSRGPGGLSRSASALTAGSWHRHDDPCARSEASKRVSGLDHETTR